MTDLRGIIGLTVECDESYWQHGDDGASRVVMLKRGIVRGGYVSNGKLDLLIEPIVDELFHRSEKDLKTVAAEDCQIIHEEKVMPGVGYRKVAGDD